MPVRAATLIVQIFRSSLLRHGTYRRFYFGTIGAALGYTMQATIAAWLMATLTPSALMVALVQTASTLPSVLIGLFAGALADIVDRRRVILVTQIVLVSATALLGALTISGAVVPATLLAFTLLIGALFTLYQPAQQASLNDLVSRSDVPRAVALGAVAFNVARAVGPALAGAIAAWLGSGSALFASSLFFFVMIVAAYRWRPPRNPPRGIPETLMSGIESGLRFARHSPPMRAILVHNLSFTVCGSSFWALLPVIARDQLGLGAGGFGLLAASFGSGAITAALLLPRGLQMMSLNTMVTIGILSWSASAIVLAASGITLVAMLGACGAGASWTAVLASLSAGTQTAAPAWVRARAVGMALVAVQASMAVGSVLWGTLASWTGTRVTLATAAAVLVLLYALNRRIRLRMGDEADVTPGVQLPDMAIGTEPLPDDGPVLIQLEYRIDTENVEKFLHAIRLVEPTRRRNGAIDWLAFRDLGDDGRFVERFIIRSWGEYVRLRTRMTMADRHVQDRVEQLQEPGVPVRVSRLIGI